MTVMSTMRRLAAYKSRWHLFKGKKGVNWLSKELYKRSSLGIVE